MKRILHTVIAALAIFAATPAKAAADTYFPYPMVPDSISTLQGKADFYITHFWDFCDLKKGFSSRAKMAGALLDYFDLMPHATPRVAFKSMATLLKNIEKQPADQLFFAQKAEEFVHSDTAFFFSDEIFLPFVRAVVENKRIPAKDKQHFIHQAAVLTATQLGQRTPDISFTDRNGNAAAYVPDSTDVNFIFFTDPGSSAARLAKARLNADAKTSRLIDAGVLKVVAIANMEPGQEWLDFAKTMPDSWVVGAAPGIDQLYDIRRTPEFYVVDNSGNILLKHATIDQIIAIVSNL